MIEKKEKVEKTFYFPITVNKENWIYWWEAKFFDWCFSQWDTLEDYWNNMTEAIQDYSESIKEWFFEVPNTWILAIKVDENGEIKNNSLKRITKNSYKILSWS